MSSRHVTTMLREMPERNEVVVTGYMMTVTTLAKLAFVAEQFGFMYADVRQLRSGTRLLLVRDPSPEAQQRAAANWQHFPQAIGGGDLPGMQPGGKLTPLPGAAPHIELLKARINFDLSGKQAEKRMIAGAAGIGLWMVWRCFVASNRGNTLVIPLVVGIVLLGILGGGFAWNRSRNIRLAQVLENSGLQRITDESGRTRYLPPAGGFPGHGNPAAGQQPPQPPVQQPQPPQPQPYQPGGQPPQQPAPYAGQPGFPPQQPPADPRQPYAPQGQPPQQGGFGPPSR